MDKVFYIAYYDDLKNADENRNFVPSAADKIQYIISAINANNFRVELISASETRNAKLYHKKRIDIGNGNSLQLFASFSGSNPIFRVLGRNLTKLQMMLHILTHIKKTDTVIAYHSLGYMKLIRLLHKVCRFRLVLEVEEIYGDVMENESVISRELQFFKIADGYLFPSILLENKVNTNAKPAAIVHGTYRVQKDEATDANNKEIHCVYAGTLDPRKGGSVAAVCAAEFLPSNYHMHILGFGSEEEKLVWEVTQRSGCSVQYHGTLFGDEYSRFLAQCHIGLSTQNPEAKFNDTSFPSKVLSYIANGLRVVSARIPVVESSGVGDLVWYYDKQTPENIARAILEINVEEPYDSATIIRELDRSFIYHMKGVLELCDSRRDKERPNAES